MGLPIKSTKRGEISTDESTYSQKTKYKNKTNLSKKPLKNVRSYFFDIPLDYLYQCSETKNETPPSSPQSFSHSPSSIKLPTKYFGLPFLTLDLIKALVRTRNNGNIIEYYFECESDSNFLARSVEFVFGNSTSLCSSFLSESDVINVRESPGIDFKSLRSSYDILNSLAPIKLFRDKIVSLCERILIDDLIKLEKTRVCDERYLRKYILMLENEHLMKSKKSHSFTKFISRVFANVKKHNKKILVIWFSNMENERIINYVNIFNACITDDFQANSDDSVTPINDSLKVMKMLFISNKMKENKGTPGIPISTFYNTTVSNSLDYKKQYKRFITNRESRINEWNSSDRGSIRTKSTHSSRDSESVRSLGLTSSAENINKKNLISNVGDSSDDNEIFSNSGLDRSTNYKISSDMSSMVSNLTLSPFSKNCIKKKSKRGSYSIIKYTFLFDPIGKTRIMHVDAVFKMLKRYGSAFINIEIVNRTCRLFENQFFYSDLPAGFNSEITPFLILEVRRDNIIEDTINQLFAKKNSLLKPLKVKFIDAGEVGVDQGGIQKEFFQIVIDKFLDPIYGLFTYNEETRISWIRGESTERLSSFEAFGNVQALALYNGAILRLNFPTTMYKKLLNNAKLDLNDLKLVDLTMGTSLEELLNYDGNDFEDLFMLDFTISYENMGVINSVPLLKNGQNIRVTKENRHRYVSLMVDYILNKKCKKQFDAYRKGYCEVLDINLIKMASCDELELMTCGSEPLEPEFAELKKNTTYNNGYTEDTPIIKWFWYILLEEFSLKQKLEFLTFCTASDRRPLGGFSRLKFNITRNGPNTHRLPTAMTCFSILMLPEYDSIERLRNSLITAIRCSSGFGLA